MQLKAAIYGRVSTDRQSELSIEAQIEACERYCEQQGWDIYDHYCDFGLSATSADKRPALQRMIRDAKAQCFNVVVAHKVDRAFRNMRDYENVKYELQKHDVFMAFTDSGPVEGVQGEFFTGLMALMAQQYSMNLSREVKKTMRKNVEQGNFLGGLPPLGYKIVDRKYTVDPETAPIVQEIFRQYAKGQSMREVADYLNSKGYRTSRGGPYQVTTLHGILKNEKYIGIYVHNRNQYNRFGKRKGKKSNDDTEVIRVEGMIPAIIDIKTWKEVQARMEKNRTLGRGKSRNKRMYLLSGLISCGECGSAYAGQPTKNSRGYETVYYTCGGRKRKNGCTNKPIKRDWIEEKVIDSVALMCQALDAEKLKEDANKIIREMKRNQDQERERHEALLAQKRREETNIVGSIARMGGNKALEERLLETQKEIENLEDYLERLAPRTIPEYKADAIAEAMQHVLNDLRTGPPEARKKALQSVVEGVEVFKDRVVVKIKAGLDETSFFRSGVADHLVAEAGFEPATSGL